MARLFLAWRAAVVFYMAAAEQRHPVLRDAGPASASFRQANEISLAA